MKNLFVFIDKTNELIFKAASWLIVPLIFGLFYEVVARYGFKAPTVWAYDLTYMLYGAMFVLGSAYVLARNKHIRVDLFYEKFSKARQRVVDILLYCILFFPPMALLVWKSYDYAIFAWEVGERSSSGSWRPSLVPLRIVFSVGMTMLLIQGAVCFIRIIRRTEKE
ncbi:MAG TPA: TRAP transporter small permease subunit [Synergistales bacterium]|nr:TRAP transporter small permease subunit [Synergistales bacterium]